MRRTAKALLIAAGLLLSAPSAFAAEAHPDKGHRYGEEHRHEQQEMDVDWSSFPADLQAYKSQLDQLKERQKAMFEQFKLQRKQIKAAHENMSEAKRNAIQADMTDLIGEFKSAKVAIRALSDQKRAAWEQFRQHTASKQWEAAKIDIQAVIARKQDILAKQQTILETQKKIVERMRK